MPTPEAPSAHPSKWPSQATGITGSAATAWSRPSLALTVAASLMAIAVPVSFAQSNDTVQRERIKSERLQAEATYTQREYECSQRFVVTACSNAAKSERRAAIESLRRQEEVLDATERRRRAAERLESIAQKTEAQAKLRPPPSEIAASSAAPAPELAGSANSSLVRQTGAADAARTDHSPLGRGSAAPPDRAASDTPPKHGAQHPPAPKKPAHVADDGAAAERASNSRQRRDKAADRRDEQARVPVSTRPQAASLPPRPDIPPGSGPGR